MFALPPSRQTYTYLGKMARSAARKSTGSPRRLITRYAGRESGFPTDDWSSELYSGVRFGLNCSSTLHEGEDSSSDEDADNYGDDDLDTVQSEDVEDAFKEEFEIGYTNEPFVFSEPTPSASLVQLEKFVRKVLKDDNNYVCCWTDENGAFSADFSSERPKPSYHEKLTKLLDDPGRELSANCLFRANFGMGQASVFAKKDIPPWTPIGIDTGALWVRSKFETMAKKEVDQMLGLFATDIKASLLKPLGYEGTDLVFESTTHGNELRFLLDPAWHYMGKQIEPNVGAFVVLTKKAPFIRLVYFTLGAEVKSGEEFAVHYGNKTWDRILTLQLGGLARMARGYHRRLENITRVIDDHGLKEESLAAAQKGAPKECKLVYYDTKNDSLFALDQEKKSFTEKFEELDPIDQLLYNVQRGRYRLGRLPKKPRTEAFSDSLDGIDPYEGIRKIDTLEVSENIRALLQDCQPTSGDLRYWNSRHKKKLREVVDGRVCKITVKEVSDPKSLVRLFTPPGERAFGACASSSIKTGEPFAIYGGRVVLEDDDSIQPDNAYLYELRKKEMAARKYHGTILLVDQERVGGPSRFVNDCWTPPGFPKRPPNCYIQLIFDPKNKLPCLVYFATCDIAEGEELIIDYGAFYWRTAFKFMMIRLTKYCITTKHRCSDLRKWLQSNHPGIAETVSIESIPGVGE